MNSRTVWALGAVVVFSIFAAGGIQRVAAAGSAGGGTFKADQVDSQIFTRENRKILCTNGQTVDKAALGFMLIEKGGATFANVTNGSGTLTTQSILAYVSSTSYAPTTPDQKIDKEGQAIRLALNGWLLNYGSHNRNKYYAVTPDIELTEHSPSHAYFIGNKYTILCKTPDTQPTEQAAESSAPSLADGLVVRNAVKELHTPKDSLQKSNSATLSYMYDDASHKSQYSTEGVYGFVLAGTTDDKAKVAAGQTAISRDISWYSIVPYLYMKANEQRPITKLSPDIRLLQPGVSANYSWVAANGGFAYDLQFVQATTIDDINQSRESLTSVRLEPYFDVPLPRLASFYVTPELGLDARQYLLFDTGTNPNLKGRTSYSSGGFDFTLHFFVLNNVSTFKNLKIDVGYLDMWSTEGIANVQTFTTHASYALPALENVTLDVKYSDGRDIDTLVNQKRVTTGFGVRF
jgi:hypothetical protein